MDKLEDLMELYDVIPPGDHGKSGWRIDKDPASNWHAVVAGDVVIALVRDQDVADGFWLFVLNTVWKDHHNTVLSKYRSRTAIAHLDCFESLVKDSDDIATISKSNKR
jgi:hypothetical protein